MPTGPTDLLWPSYTEGGIEKWAKTNLRTGPDFGDITKAFSSLMSNPSLIARGGTWNDPQQAQQEATGGYLSARGGVAQNKLSEDTADAGLATSAGQARGQLLQLIPQLLTSQLGAQGSLFGSLLGGLQ
jgi:hypothetical protein